LIRYPDWKCNLHMVNKMGYLSIGQFNPGASCEVKNNRTSQL